MSALVMAHPLLSGRSRMTRDGDALVIAFRAFEANGPAIAGAMLGFAVAGIALPLWLARSETPVSAGDIAQFSALGVVSLLVLIWVFLGRQEVRVDSETLAIATVVGPLRRTRRVSRSAIRALRVDVRAGDKSFNRIDTFVIAGGSIAADTTKGELRFGLRLGEDNAQQVVDEIEELWR